MNGSTKQTIHVGRPNLGNRDDFLRRVNQILDRRWLSNNGPVVQEFEKKVAETLGVKNAIAICNATAALEIAYKALEFKDEVIIPSYTFIATAHALQWQGIRPIFCDIDPNSHNIDPKKIERLITPKTTGIVGVHVWGRACDTNNIEKIAAKYGLKVMYDSSHAFLCSNRGRMLGSFGECEVFSFHATKFINCLEGGIITTNNDELAYKIRMMTNFGFVGYDKVEYLGTNGKMNEVSAAMGLTNLESIDKILCINRRNYKLYTEKLSALTGISIINYNVEESNNYQYVVIEVHPDLCPISRDEIVDALHAENVIARKYFWPGCHRMEPYKTIYQQVDHDLQVTDRIAAQVIVLPTGESVDTSIINRICSIIHNIIK
jgi:dTDP-4-amino-4,6-dideoxygalactose transaminase